MKLSPSTEAEQLVLEFLRRVWQPPHDLGAIDVLMTEDYEIVSGGVLVSGRQSFKAWVAEFQHHLLDVRTDNLEVFANPAGDRVVSRWRCSGKNNGLLGLPADGRAVAFTGIAIWHVRDRRLAACWVERSAWELYQEMTRTNLAH